MCDIMYAALFVDQDGRIDRICDIAQIKTQSMGYDKVDSSRMVRTKPYLAMVRIEFSERSTGMDVLRRSGITKGKFLFRLGKPNSRMSSTRLKYPDGIKRNSWMNISQMGKVLQLVFQLV